MFDPAVLAATDIAGLANNGLVERFRSLELERRRREVEVALIVNEIERRGFFVEDGMRTVASWCRGIARWTRGEARQVQRVGRLLHQYDDVLAEAASAAIPAAHLRELARAAANPRCGSEIDEFLPALVEHAKSMEFDDFQVVTRRWESSADLDGAHRESEHSHARRRATMIANEDLVHTHATHAGLDGALMLEIFEKYCDAEFRTDWQQTVERYGDAAAPHLMPRSAAQRRADAMLRIFIDAASRPPGSKEPAWVVNVVVPYDVFVAAGGAMASRASSLVPEDRRDDAGEDEDVGQDELFDLDDTGDGDDLDDADDDAAVAGDEPAPPPASAPPARRIDPADLRCHSRFGVWLNPYDVFTVAMVGTIRRVVIDSKGIVVDAGRRRRLFSPSQRAAMMAVTNRCPLPGCGTHHGLQADHVRTWKDHGTTSTGNGEMDCGWHNRLKNMGFTYVRDDAGRWRLFRPDGTEVETI